ncbi:uncharacterized protein LOC106646520 [Copidosoma floridanum]|uniref:uncharacterized protein LOC106646520 n=1 Tax=Copidosoma floridanum TaxID=29053 RepID=UPI0006C9C8CD|nr:uncharacterized protein LOC106646520 [Copidosoma floridanum]
MRDHYIVCLAVVLATLLITADAGDMLRKSIVYDKNTPDVFYCPPHKPTRLDKMIVKAKPLSKLCQFEGGPIPKDYKSDCYNDVDESDYACQEKRRIMKRLKNAEGDQLPVDNEYTE